jgi:tight adherence protein B
METAFTMSLVSFFIVAGFTITCGWLLVGRRDLVKERLSKYVNESAEPRMYEQVQRTEQKERKRRRLNVSSSFMIARVLDTEIEKAGLYLRSSEVLLSALVLCGAGVTVGLVLTQYGSVLAVALGLVGLSMPFMYIKLMQRKRRNMFSSQIVDAFGLISNSLKAGHSFFQAMGLASREMQPPIADEFGRVVKEVSIGVSVEEALTDMGERVDSDDLDLVITAVLIQRQVGGNLSEILDNIADTVRQRIQIKGEIKTLTAQGRISGLVIAVLPFILAMILYLMNPDYMSILFTHPMGKLMIAWVIISEIVGAVIINKIINIKV